MNEWNTLRPYMTDRRAQRITDVLAKRSRDVTVVIDRIDKPHNFMAVLRTCECFGIQDVHIVLMPEQTPESMSQAVTQGAHKWLTIRTYPEFDKCLERLKDRKYKLYASYLDENAATMDSLNYSGRIALVFGNELEGLSRDVVEKCDGVFHIPMSGFSQSFNISVACALSIQRLLLLKQASGEALSTLSDSERESLLNDWAVKAVPNSKRILSDAAQRAKSALGDRK